MSSVIASNIPSNTTPAEVREYFSKQAGEVSDLIPLGDDGKVKKYEILFKDKTSVKAALDLSDSYIDGIAIRVDEVPELTDGQVGKAPQQQGLQIEIKKCIYLVENIYQMFPLHKNQYLCSTAKLDVSFRLLCVSYNIVP